MKKILLLLMVSISSFAQSFKVEMGSNMTTYVFTNSSGIIPSFFRPSTGLHLGLSRELNITKTILFDFGINFDQFNNEGDVQNIPFSYATDFMGINVGIGPSLNLGKGITFNPKINVLAASMVKGNQFIQNRYVDLSGDEQFNSLRTMFGYSFELSKQVNPHIGVFVKYQHLDSYKFGSSTLNLIPSTFSLGLSLNK
jgi:hypothetical protein